MEEEKYVADQRQRSMMRDLVLLWAASARCGWLVRETASWIDFSRLSGFAGVSELRVENNARVPTLRRWRQVRMTACASAREQ